MIHHCMHKKYLPTTLAAILLLVSALSSCKKDKVDLLDPVPVILSVTVSPTQVVELQDSIVFEVEYRDGDGDLGENSPDVSNLFLVDNRINVTQEFRIRELAPSGSDIPITGILRVVLRNTGITDNSNSQTFDYTVYVRDRAGNESNRFVTPSITVTR
jgi:hypothetical protein